jgi:phosphoglycolate phosphatase
MTPLQGLIFDLDGTLLDSAPDLRQALNLTLREHGHASLTLDEVKSLIGDGMLAMLKKAFALTGAAKSDADSYPTFSTFITHYRKLKPDQSQIFPEVISMLEMFQKKDIQLGICTNKQEAATIQLLEALNLKKYFKCIAGGDTFPIHKPHPDHVRGVIHDLGIAPKRCAMIGDSINDVLAAHGAGIPCLVVTHGYSSQIDDLKADVFISGFHELPEGLRKLGFTY